MSDSTCFGVGSWDRKRPVRRRSLDIPCYRTSLRAEGRAAWRARSFQAPPQVTLVAEWEGLPEARLA